MNGCSNVSAHRDMRVRCACNVPEAFSLQAFAADAILADACSLHAFAADATFTCARCLIARVYHRCDEVAKERMGLFFLGCCPMVDMLAWERLSLMLSKRRALHGHSVLNRVSF